MAGVGKHIITYTIGKQSNCGVSRTQEIEVKPDITLGLPKSITVQPNETITIPTKPSQNDLTFDWTPIEGLNNPASPTPSATVTNNIVYTVKATSPDRCTVEESIQINVGEKFVISTVFSPNNDGINDFWKIKGIENFPECEVFIYNTWGELIFYSKGYTSDWDGKYKGKEVPAGMCLFKIDTKKDYKVVLGYITIIY